VPSQLKSTRIEVDDALEAIELYFENAWTDGLPVVPPTEARVMQFLAACGHEPDDVIGTVPQRRRIVTAEKIAINAVMAGCRPEYMPVIIAAFQAMTEELFNLHGITVTTGGPAPLLIVNGPIAKRLGMNAGVSIFGPGWRSNATIGRAIRLILINACGTEPGVMDKATIGHPGKFSFCIAEDEENSPWEPLHVMKGFDRKQSAVTVFACDAPKQVANNRDPLCILDTIAATVTDPGSISVPAVGEFLVVVPVEPRAHLHDAGWSKRDMQEYLFEHTMLTAEDYTKVRRHPMRQLSEEGAQPSYPSVEKPEDFLITAGGGPAGAFTAVLPPWWGRVSYSVTRQIDE
jgi:hypothetical protein